MAPLSHLSMTHQEPLDSIQASLALSSEDEFQALLSPLRQLREQELARIASVGDIREMGGSHDQSTVANHISHCAVDLGLILGEVGNLAVLLCISGISEEYNTLNLLLDIIRELGDRIIHDGSSLTRFLMRLAFCWKLKTGYSENIWRALTYLYPPATICVSGHLLTACLKRPSASVIAAGEVFPGRALERRSAVYAGPTPWQATWPVLAIFRSLQTAGPVEMPYLAKWASNTFIAFWRNSITKRTIRPGSVEARAKMNVIGLQSPSRSSFPLFSTKRQCSVWSILNSRWGELRVFNVEHTLSLLNGNGACNDRSSKSQKKTKIHDCRVKDWLVRK